jgi:hypothetical protein
MNVCQKQLSNIFVIGKEYSLKHLWSIWDSKLESFRSVTCVILHVVQGIAMATLVKLVAQGLVPASSGMLPLIEYS